MNLYLFVGVNDNGEAIDLFVRAETIDEAKEIFTETVHEAEWVDYTDDPVSYCSHIFQVPTNNGPMGEIPWDTVPDFLDEGVST